MLNHPQTLEEAKACRYNIWGGNPDGNNYKEGLCVYEVELTGPGPSSFQCQRKNGKGLAELYCWQHAKIVEALEGSTDNDNN